MISTKRTRGRPPLDERDPSVGMNVRVPSAQYDAFARRAIREQVSVAEIVRRELRVARAAGKDTTTGRQR